VSAFVLLGPDTFYETPPDRNSEKIERSMFISFFFDLTGRFFWPAAGLNPDT
jgi:hypothetical protein